MLEDTLTLSGILLDSPLLFVKGKNNLFCSTFVDHVYVLLNFVCYVYIFDKFLTQILFLMDTLLAQS